MAAPTTSQDDVNKKAQPVTATDNGKEEYIPTHSSNRKFSVANSSSHSSLNHRAADTLAAIVPSNTSKPASSANGTLGEEIAKLAGKNPWVWSTV